MHQPFSFHEALPWMTGKFLESLDECPYVTLDFHPPEFGPPPHQPTIEMIAELNAIFEYFATRLIAPKISLPREEVEAKFNIRPGGLIP